MNWKELVILPAMAAGLAYAVVACGSDDPVPSETPERVVLDSRDWQSITDPETGKEYRCITAIAGNFALFCDEVDG